MRSIPRESSIRGGCTSSSEEHEKGLMYTLYYSPGSCSLIVHSLLEELLTECMAIVEYLCDRHGDGKLLAEHGTWRRAKTLERMATLATEVHPLFNRFFHVDDFSAAADVQAAVKARGAEKHVAWFRQEDAALTAPYWSGDTLTAADYYFMVVTRWGRFLDPP